MKEIHIKSGDAIYIALVDDEDYPVVSRFKWSVLFVNGRRKAYAFTRLHNENMDNGKTFLMHHLVLGCSSQADHINGNSLDNQKSNLRHATIQQNGWNKCKNTSSHGKKCTSQYKGVRRVESKTKGTRWLAYFKHVEPGAHKSTGRYIWIGYYPTEIEAAKAYNREIVKYRGEWAWINPIPE